MKNLSPTTSTRRASEEWAALKLPRFRIALVLLFAFFASRARAIDVPPPVAAAEKDRIAAIAKATRSAVAIFTPDGNGGGSGVVITSDGYALSNFHVTSPVGDYLKCGMTDGKLYDAVIVSIDPTGDVAMIKLLGRTDFVPADLADSDQVQAGDWCFAVGNPFLLATDFQPSVSFGLVSGVHRYQYPAGSILEYADCIQTDAAINPGNSGGPLFNARGELIGIVGRGSFEKRGRVNVGVGYAISINQVKNFLGHLHSGTVLDHATLGATVDRDEQGHVVISNILENSDVYRRGVRTGDELLAFGGRPITSVNAFKNVLGIFPAGWRVPLSYRHDGERHDIYVRLSALHTRAELDELLQGPDSQEIPRDIDPDEKKKDKKKDDPQPRRPRIRPQHPDQPKVTVPEEAAKLIVSRTGFKNYYFNELNRERVWKQYVALGDFSAHTMPWTLQGQLAGGGEFKATLGETESKLQLPNSDAEVTAAKDLNEQLDPGGTGLLAALHIWRRMLVQGSQKFGEVRYLGKAPIPGREGLFDVLIATHNVAESLIYFEPATGKLVALEMFPDSEADACELLFDNYQSVGGKQFPHSIVARRGNSVIAEMQVSKVELP